MTKSLDKPTFGRNNSSRSAFNRNNDSKPVSKKNNGNNEVNRFNISGNNIVMSWPRDLSRDLISHHIQRHSTKSTDRTYLSPCSWRLTYPIHQPVILLQFRILTHQHLVCWDLTFFIWITSRSPTIDKDLQSRTNLGWCLHWEDVTPFWNISTVP